MAKYVISLDAGTTSSRTILFTHDGEIAAVDQKEFTQIFPQPGWVEHDPLEIWETQRQTLIGAMENAGARPSDIAGIGITNQRETTVVWDKNTGEPVYNAIVWQCRRTAERIEQLKADGLSDYVQQTTGLIPDPYFSGSKIAWILDEVPGARERAEAGDLLFGTIDTWLTWKLTGGRAHVTDVTNASRTMIFDIHNLCWDKKLLEYFRIPESMLPRVASSSEIVGYTDATITGGEIPVSGIAGDQQAALFGQCCTCSGDVKNTYGTGCFTLMNTGTKAITSSNGLLTTIAYGYGGKVYYALEGSVFVAGASIQWLRDEMRVLESARDSEKSCLAVEDTAGVYVVPAFAGLGAPYWNPYARGMVTGLTRGTSRDHFIRATVESMAYQVYDLIKAMEKDSGLSLATLKVDGGAAANNFLMQFQADLLDKNIERPKCIETTAQGAAYLAGLATGFWKDLDDVAANRKVARVFTSEISEEIRNERISGWEKAVDACSYWGKKA